MHIVTVRARRGFTYGGLWREVGQPVAMSPVDAAIAARQGYVSLTRGAYATRAMVAAPPAPMPEPEPVVEAPRRRRRRRSAASDSA